MHTTTLLASAIRRLSDAPVLPCATTDAVCCLTGRRTACIPRGELLSSSFTESHLLAAPGSEWIGADVFTAWRYGKRAEGKSRDMRPEANQCWWTDGERFETARKPLMRDVVLRGSVTVPWALWITTGYKKHGSLRAPVNNTERGRVGFDELVVDCRDARAVADMWDRLNAALAAGIGRTVIETLDCPPHVIKAVGLAAWMGFETWARTRYNSGLYRLLTYLLPSQEERKEAGECASAS